MKCTSVLALACWSVILLSAPVSYGQGNYWEYHKNINKAEHSFFMKNDPKHAFLIYDQLAGAYSFHFVKDFFLAAQIACKNSDHGRAYKYLEICFRNGLNIAQLALSPVFAQAGFDGGNARLQALYQQCRKEYLNRMDTAYRKKIYKLYAQDQIDKSLPTGKYNELLANNLNELINWVRTKGFPSDKTIGIDDSTISIEGRTLMQWYIATCKANGIVPDQHIGQAEDNLLSSCTGLYFLVHHPCAVQQLGPYISEEIKKGNMHPRDAGMLYDNMIRMKKLSGDKKLSCAPQPANGPYFKLNSFLSYPADWRKDIHRIDSIRQQFSIAPILQDSVKQSKIKAYNFYNKFGFWGCR